MKSLRDNLRDRRSHLEVGTRTASDWEHAILTGHDMFRQLVAHNGRQHRVRR
ncbi:hypothetical protein [Kibdelosporangium aridum]|uniref:hypothetical protein n=1 Tax=Kibdelosporangium aridum TaxID=2030 RepID=UPI0035E78C45